MFLYFDSKSGYWWFSYYGPNGHKILSRQATGAFKEVERELGKIAGKELGFDPFEKFTTWKSMIYFSLDHIGNSDKRAAKKFNGAGILKLAEAFPGKEFRRVSNGKILVYLDESCVSDSKNFYELHLDFLKRMYEFALQRRMVKENPFK